jgi:hypothetical protein
MILSHKLFFSVISYSKLFGSRAVEGNLTVLVLHLKQEIFQRISWLCLHFVRYNMIRNATVYIISLHELFKFNICISFTCIVSSGLIRDVKWTNLFCLFLILKCRKYRHDEAKKISYKGVAAHKWQASVKCVV